MNTHWQALFMVLSLAGSALLASSPAQAQLATDEDRADLEQLRSTTLALIQAPVEQGLISRERADALIRQAAQRRAPAVAVAPAGGACALPA